MQTPLHSLTSLSATPTPPPNSSSRSNTMQHRNEQRQHFKQQQQHTFYGSENEHQSHKGIGKLTTTTTAATEQILKPAAATTVIMQPQKSANVQPPSTKVTAEKGTTPTTAAEESTDKYWRQCGALEKPLNSSTRDVSNIKSINSNKTACSGYSTKKPNLLFNKFHPTGQIVHWLLTSLLIYLTMGECEMKIETKILNDYT